MRFDQASQVDQIAYEMRLADYPRSLDRARVDDLMNGVPPYTGEEAQKNGIEINVNFLEPTRLAHDARSQFLGNFLKPGRFFNCRTDMGPTHRRVPRSNFVTGQIARLMKESSIYYETFRSKTALDVLHGIGPAGWDNEDFWCPDAYGVEDVLVPANTLLTMKNLPFFILYHSYTGPELMKLTRDRKVAKEAGWNVDLVDKAVEYLDRETMALTHNQWPEIWSPEKLVERTKGDGGFYAADSVPTIDCFDFYFWNDDDHEEGWCRRLILDAWSTPESAGANGWTMNRNSKLDFTRNQFLFTSGKRKVASRWQEIVTWQFADLSAVAPFRYHSTRGLGYLLYAVGNLQNRLRCRFNECVWESSLMYLRVKSLDDAERALKVELANRGFIDESVQFIPANERFQVNHQLLQMGLAENNRIIAENSSSYVQNPARMGEDRTERTKFEVMARIQMMTSLISAGLQQAYRYQEFEYREIFRRFLKPNSRDPDVKRFRAACLNYGIPENMLVPEAWDIEPERVLGAGNKTLEMAIAEQLMSFRPLYDPEPQREILRDVTLAITDDPRRAEALVPESPAKVTDSVHDAEMATAALMMGMPVSIKSGMNHIEYVDTLMRNVTILVMKIQKQQGNMARPDQLEGLTMMLQHIEQHVELVSQDKAEKERVNKWKGILTKMGNAVKGFAQRLQEQAQQQAAQGPQLDPETMAKIQSMKVLADAKAANTRESHAQRTAQRQVQWEMEQKRENAEAERQAGQATQDQIVELQKEIAKLKMQLQAKQAEHQLDYHRKVGETRLDLHKKAVETALDVAAERRKAAIKPRNPDND